MWVSVPCSGLVKLTHLCERKPWRNHFSTHNSLKNQLVAENKKRKNGVMVKGKPEK